ncbi:PREDICTED: odorant receptor 4-like [Wasmannia auropunctata]|uniref:odorant receptor 4-like n=1 Tax=Wasmannia auropunctata TaxID=64793 RepID=UPI0005F010AF|nr:PREDICTED: odorant receptor 4-like [Wasmannia auropunctata]
MFANKYYERDIENAFAMNRFFFRIIGMWPFARANSPLLKSMETVALVLACFVSLLSELIPTMLYVFMVLTDARLRLRVVGNAIFTAVELVKYVYVLFYKSQVRSCLILVDEDWRNVVNPSDRVSMLDKVRIGKRLLAMCALFVYLTGMSFRIIMPLSTGKVVTPQNVTIRPLPCVSYLVVLDVQRSPVYEIVFFVQFLSGFVKYTITVATFGFVTLCAMHYCAQADALVTLINDFVNENRPERLNKRLATVVEHQIRIRNFLQLVQSVTQYPNLIEVLGSTIMICFAGYYAIAEWENHNIVRLLTYFISLAMFLFNIFIYCYMGEQIVEQGEKIALTACTLEWHRLPDAKARELILLISISDTPLKLKAGNFIELCLRTFGNIVKMAVTYLNLLRSIE